MLIVALVILALLILIVIPVAIYRNNQKKIEPIVEKVETVIEAAKDATK